MSLDVYLRTDSVSHSDKNGAIFVRENGQNVQISEEEWERRYPGREPVRFEAPFSGSDEAFSANITHNLGRMAAAAGIYEAVWRPEEIGITKASQLIEPLRRGIASMKADPAKFEAYNPSNGWGSYEGFVPWLERYLAACEEYPDATVTASR